MTDQITTDTIQGPVALTVEQAPCKRQVAGSTPGQGLHEALYDFYKKLKDNQKPLEPEFQQVIDDNLWDLLGKT